MLFCCRLLHCLPLCEDLMSRQHQSTAGHKESWPLTLLRQNLTRHKPTGTCVVFDASYSETWQFLWLKEFCLPHFLFFFNLIGNSIFKFFLLFGWYLFCRTDTIPRCFNACSLILITMNHMSLFVSRTNPWNTALTAQQVSSTVCI